MKIYCCNGGGGELSPDKMPKNDIENNSNIQNEKDKDSN